jgi:IclR family mhp operon transcriptional activator
MDRRQYLSSLRRGLKVLALLNQKVSATMAEMARAIDLPRTTTRRIVDTLIDEGYVERIPDCRSYRLTPVVNILSNGFSDESWVSHVASPLLFDTTREIGWPLSLATPLGEDVMVRVSTDRATSLAIDHFHIGYKTPIMHSAAGRVMLAFASPVYRAALLELLNRSEDPHQADARNPNMVAHIVEKIQARGFEHMSYVNFPESCLCVPVFLNGSVVGCLSLLYIKRALTARAAEERFVPLLQNLSRRIEREVIELRERIDTRSGDDIALSAVLR